jgi:transcriptional regulator with XRE-family HTH domain
MRCLKNARKASGLTLHELSEATGLSPVALSRLEQGHTVGKLSTKIRVEQALDTRINWLDSEPILKNSILSDWLECEMLFRLLVQKVNGLVEKNERQEFIDTAGRYLRRMKRKD